MYTPILKQLVEKVPNATGCILVDHHGEEINTYAPDQEYEMKLLGAHMVPIHQRIETISERVNSGSHDIILIRTDNDYILTAPLKNNTYIILRLSPSPRITPSIEKLKKAIYDIIEEG
jgi:predicted regulator of Ras-like GTPase activity (Roadblock/LC7/MglB family)